MQTVSLSIAGFQCLAIQNRFWKKKEGKYAKTLAKIRVTAIFLKQGMRKFFAQIYRDLYGDAMLEPIRMGTNMAAGNQQKHLSLSKCPTKA